MITTLNEWRRINETLTKRKEDDEIFDYGRIISDLWRPRILKAQEFQHINFDLENNDTLGEKKTLYITKDLRKEQPVKYEYNLELCCAGGDWECPVMYFKVEITHDYTYGAGTRLPKPEFVWDIKDEDYSNDHYVIIPGPEDGNHLVKTEKGYTAHDGEDKVKITDEDKKKAWKWIEKLFIDMVEARHEMLDESETELSSEPAPTDTPEK